MNKIYKMVHSGNEYYVDESGIRKYYFDMLVNDINERDFDTIEWLDDTRDLDSQLDFIRFAKYGDFKDIVKSLKTSECIEITELKTYKELLQFYVDYLKGKITDYYLYDNDNMGLPYHEMIKDMLDKLNKVADRYAMSDYDKLVAILETKAYEIDSFESLFKEIYTSVFKEFEDYLEDFNTRVYRYTTGEDKVADINYNDSRNLDDLLNILLKLQKNL